MERFIAPKHTSPEGAEAVMLTAYTEAVANVHLALQQAQEVVERARAAGETASLQAAEEMLHFALCEYVETTANYPGDWTLLQRERFLHPQITERFRQLRTAYMAEMKTGAVGMLDKPKKFQDHYAAQLQGYTANIDRVFAATDVGLANDHGKSSASLGSGNIGWEGMVFDDAQMHDGTPLTVRQKNIIEAHEKYHGMVDFESTERADLVRMFDPVVAEYLFDDRFDTDDHSAQVNYNYLTNPNEITARLAQLKNYFGMCGDETFTREHWRYAREHYVHDVGLDNNMTSFLAMITEKTLEDFLRIINTYPI